MSPTGAEGRRVPRRRIKPRPDHLKKPTLEQFLTDSPAERLRSIHKAWKLPGSLPADHEQQVDYLLLRMRSDEYFRPALAALSEAQQGIIRFLAIHGSILPRNELQERLFPSAAAVCDATLALLRNNGFLFDVTLDCPEPLELIALPDEFTVLVDLPPHCQGYLGRLLQETDAETRLEVAKRVFDDDKILETDDALCFRIRRHLLDTVALMAYVNTLGDVEHEIFRTLTDRRGFALYRDLLESVSSKKFDHTRAELLNGLIQASGLMFQVAEGHNKHMNLIAMPKDVLWMVTNGFHADTRGLEEIDALSVPNGDGRRLDIVDNSSRLLRDLAILAARIDVQNVRRLAGGGVNKIELRRIQENVVPNKPIGYVALLSQFLISQRHLFDLDGRWRADEGLRDWFATPVESWRDLYGWWLRNTIWAEDSAERPLPVAEASAADAVAILTLRKVILEGLGSTAKDQWISVQAFYDSLAPQIENLIPNHPWGPGSRRLQLRDVFENLIGESLAWLGMVAVGRPVSTRSDDHDTNSGATATKGRGRGRKKIEKPATDSASLSEWVFQQTELARRLFPTGMLLDLELASDETLDAPQFHFGAEWLIVQPNLEVVAPPDLNLSIVYDLARWSHVKSVDVMTTFEITKDSIRQALDSGLRPIEFTELLDKCSRVPVPDTVKRLIEECVNRHGEVQVHAASGFITLDDNELLDALRQHPRLSSMVKQVIADQVAILAEGVDLSKLVRELRTQGFMPRLESSSVHASGDDRYHLSLEPDEYYDIIAAVRLVAAADESLEADVSEGKAPALLKKLLPTGENLFQHEERIETVSRSYAKRFQAALQKHIDEIEDRYKDQVSRLVTKSMSARGPSRHNYRGKNPAENFDDIYKMLEFCCEFELDVEIQYVKQNNQETRVVISPKSFQGDRVYAHCPANDSDGIYAIRRMLSARLV